MSGEFSKIRHLCDMFSKTNPKQFYLSGFGSAFPDEGRGGGFWLLQKWDAIDNLRTSSSPNWWFDSSWFLPFGRKKHQRTSNIFGKHVTQGVTKNWRPQRPPKRFAASTMLYFFEMATYLKGHGLTEIWRRKLPIIRLERSQKTWCKVGKKPEVGSDLYHCSECFYILFSPKKIEWYFVAPGWWISMNVKILRGSLVEILPRVAAPWSAASGKRTTTALSST